MKSVILIFITVFPSFISFCQDQIQGRYYNNEMVITDITNAIGSMHVIIHNPINEIFGNYMIQSESMWFDYGINGCSVVMYKQDGKKLDSLLVSSTEIVYKKNKLVAGMELKKIEKSFAVADLKIKYLADLKGQRAGYIIGKSLAKDIVIEIQDNKFMGVFGFGNYQKSLDNFNRILKNNFEKKINQKSF